MRRVHSTSRSVAGRIAQLVRASGLHPEGQGFESLFAHQKVVVQTGDITGLRPRLSGPSLVAGRYRLHSRVEERVERFSRFTGDGAFFTKVELVEECRVGDTPQRSEERRVGDGGWRRGAGSAGKRPTSR